MKGLLLKPSFLKCLPENVFYFLKLWVTRFRFNIFVRYFSSGTGPRSFSDDVCHLLFSQQTSRGRWFPCIIDRKNQVASHPCAYQVISQHRTISEPGFSCDSATSAPCTAPSCLPTINLRSKVEENLQSTIIKRVLLWPVFEFLPGWHGSALHVKAVKDESRQPGLRTRL